MAILAIVRPGVRPGLEFAGFGALHAAALVLSIAGAKPSLGRRLLFVGVAAIFALATARLGLLGWRVMGSLGGSVGPIPVLGASAAFGALAYGWSIRAILISGRRAGSGMMWLCAAALGCALVTSLGAVLARALHIASVLWVVVPWWLAFSVSLCIAGVGPLRRHGLYADAAESHKMSGP